MVVLSSLVRVVRLLLQSWPTLFTYERIAVLFIFLGIVLEECRGSRGLRLIVVAGVPADILTLIKLIILLHVLLHGLADRMILVVVHYVRVRHVLREDATTALYHWKLLSIKVFIRIRGETTTNWLLLILLVIATCRQIR